MTRYFLDIEPPPVAALRDELQTSIRAFYDDPQTEVELNSAQTGYHLQLRIRRPNPRRAEWVYPLTRYIAEFHPRVKLKSISAFANGQTIHEDSSEGPAKWTEALREVEQEQLDIGLKPTRLLLLLDAVETLLVFRKPPDPLEIQKARDSLARGLPYKPARVTIVVLTSAGG